MKHLDNYLKTVGTFLPSAQKDDILKELSENIRSKIEDRESELGRPLTEAEQEDILKGYGNPMVVASRYRTDSGGGLTFGIQLISPALFPLYAKVLGLNLLFAFAVVIILTFVLDLPYSGTFSRFIVHALMQSAAVTLVFVLLQRYLNDHPDQWLTEDDIIKAKDRTAVKAKPRLSRFEAIFQIIILLVVISILQEVLAAPNQMFAPFQPAPILYQLYIPFILFQVVGIAQATVGLFRPDWVRFHSTIQMGTEIASLIILGILLVAGQWVVLVNTASFTAAEQQKLAEILGYVNQYFFYGLLIGVVISVVQLVMKIRQLRRKSD